MNRYFGAVVIVLGNSNESLVGYFWKYASCKYARLKHHAVRCWKYILDSSYLRATGQESYSFIISCPQVFK